MYGSQHPSAQSEPYAMTPALSRIVARDKVAWSHDVWKRIDEAVHAESQRIGIADKFLPMYGPLEVTKTYVPADIVVTGQPTLNVDETRTTAVVEIQVFFELTRQQMDDEEYLGTAVTLGTRGGNVLRQAKDVLILQGEAALSPIPNPLFRPGLVEIKSGRQGIGRGLVFLPDSSPENDQIRDRLVVQVRAIRPRPGDADTQTRWGENTFEAVARAYSNLQSGQGFSQAHYGPYCCVLQHVQYADTHAPLENTLILTADRIKPLVNDCFWGTGTVPAFTGFVASFGGNTVDICEVLAPTVAWVQDDERGNCRMKVFERFVARKKTTDFVVRLDFETGFESGVFGSGGTPGSTSGGPA